MSPVHPFLPGVAEKVAAGAVMSLLKASALGIRRSLGKGEEEKALRAAVTEALTEALASQELNEEMSEHYAGLLAEFFAREEAAIELSQLLDPRPNQAPDLNTLAQEFRMAGYDPDRMSGFDLDSFLRSFFSAFYAAAGRQPSLQAGINLKLLGTQLQQLGIVAEATVRTAEAAERSAGSLERLLQEYMKGKAEEQELRRRVDAALGGGFLQAYRMFEGFRIVLLSAGLDLGVNAQGVLEIVGPASEGPSTSRLETIRTLAGELRGAVLDHTPSEEDLNALEARYRQHVIRWFGHLEFRGLMRTPKPIVLPLEEIYVELRAVAEVPEAADAFSVEERRLLLDMGEQDETTRRELLSQLDAFRRERWSRTIPERKSMAEALHQRDRRAFVILGDPGSGKTTLLHFLALVYARGADIAARSLGVDAAEADRLPIFVPLAAFDDMLRESRREEGRSLTLQDFLPRYYDRRRGLPGLEPLFRRALESGRALVLLDGLDEVLDVTTRRYVAEQAGALIGEWIARGVRFALSSRFVGYREAPVPGNLPTLSVLDFGTPEIETFVRKWSFTFEKWVARGEESPEMRQKAQTLEAGLLEDVRSNESVRRLAANPLMLTMLALLRRQVGRLPHRRVQLYESYVGTLLENWVDARSEGAREQSVAILDRHQAENILIPLAFWLQQEKPSGTAGRAEIRRKLVEICLADRGIVPARAERLAEKEAEGQADRFLREMRQMAGLLIERGHDAFGFLHLTFQEYFAGRALAQLGDRERWDAIRSHLHNPRWREPILLCAGRLGVVENRRPQVTQLVRDILENEDPTEVDLYRNLLLALAITCDDVNLDPTLISELVDRVISLLATPIHVLARDLIRLLGQLVANGMASFEACLPSIEQAGVNRKRIVIKELGRFSEIKEIGQWLRRQLDSGHDTIVAAAFEALTPQMGESSLWQKAIEKWAVSWEIGYAVARALTQVAKDKIEVRQRLLEIVGHGEMLPKIYALYALADLVKTHAEVRNVFLAALHDSIGHVRVAAIEGLSLLASEDAEARGAILAIVGSEEWYVHLSAIDALAGVVGEDGEVRRIILEFLKDRHPEGRYPAVEALSRVLNSDHEALSRVMDLLSAKGVSSDLLASLTLCVSSVPEIRQAFLQELAAQDWAARQVACQGLIDAGSGSFEDLATVLRSRECLEAVETLAGFAEFLTNRVEEGWRELWCNRLQDPAPRHRRAAVIALTKLICTSEEVRRAVLGSLKDRSFRVLDSALLALSGAVGSYAEVRQAVLRRLKDKDSGVRCSALSALSGAVGSNAEVRQAVLRRLKDKDSDVRRSAFWALSEAVGSDAEIRQAVLGGLKDKDSEVRYTTLSVLSGAVGSDVEVRRAVLGSLKDKDSGVRYAALSALSGAVGSDVEVRQAVLESLKDKDSGVRQSALSSLSGAVGSDSEVRRAVLAGLKDKDLGVQYAALSALSGAVGLDTKVRRAVLGRLKDEFYGVRYAAFSSLSGAIGSDTKIRRAILQKFEDQAFPIRMQVVEVVTRSGEEILFESLNSRLTGWLGVDAEPGPYHYESSVVRSLQAQLAKRFGAKLPTDPSLRDLLLKQLADSRSSTRIGAALAFLAWPGGPPDEILTQVLAALEDRRGLEAYPAQLTAAAALINQNDYAAEAIDLCLEALGYGTQPWEDLYRSREVRRQAALVLGKLEPVFYDSRIYDKLLHVLHNDEDDDVRDAAYGTLVRLARIRDQQLC